MPRILLRLLAAAALQWLLRERPDIARVNSIHIDWVVAGFTVAVVALCALFAGLVSALGAGGKNVLSALHESSRAHSAGAGRTRLRRILRASLPWAISLALVIAAWGITQLQKPDDAIYDSFVTHAAIGEQATIDIRHDYLDDTRMELPRPHAPRRRDTPGIFRPWLARLLRQGRT